jgi:antitoxin component of RelBE/YafQ-DinJ toxin-antitoxin module
MNNKQVILSEEVVVKAEARARALGLTLTEYVQALVNQDAKTKEYNPWLEPIPKEVDEQWEKDLAEIEEQEKTNPRPHAKTVAEFRKLLKEEAAQLTDNEGN